jgi:hypothetical protein
MPEWAIPVMFYGMAVLIIAALIAEFRGASRPGDAADSLHNGDEPQRTSEDPILVDLASAAGLQDDQAEDP